MDATLAGSWVKLAVTAGEGGEELVGVAVDDEAREVVFSSAHLVSRDVPLYCT